MEKESNIFKISIVFLAALDMIVWYLIFSPAALAGPELYFLKVGQGDSSLAILPGNANASAKFLIDGGPLNGGLGANLDKIFRADDRYIDLVFVSHPEVDHFGGLIGILKNYNIGAVLYNGDESEDVNWKEFNKIVLEKHIRKIGLDVGDGVSYASSTVAVLNSGGQFANSNDSGLALLLGSGGIKALYTADLSAEAERAIAAAGNLEADILKVSHHGSKYSSDLSFLKEVMPKVSVIEVGKNSYGHPATTTLAKLKSVGSKVFRTDYDGIVKITENNNRLQVFKIDL